MTWEHDADHHDRLRGHRIRITLRSLPGILEDLEPTPSVGNGVRGTERLLPISEKVIEAKQNAKSTLVSWALLVAQEASVPIHCDDTMTSIATWLQGHTEWLGKHDAAEDAEEEIHQAITTLEHLTDRPGPTVFAGNCPTCDAPAYAPEGRTETRCRMVGADSEPCGTMIDVHEGRAALLEQAGDMTASAVDISRILPVKAATVRQWGRRGKLGGYCDTTTRETRWLIGTVMDQISRTAPIAA